MKMRQILSRRNNKGARLALSILLTVSMLLGSVPNGALKAMAEELEQVPVEEVVPDAGEQATDGVAVAGETPAEDAGGEAAADQGEEPQDGTVVADSQDSEQDPAVTDAAGDPADVTAPLAAPAPGGLLGNPMPGPSGDGLVHAWADPDTRTTVDTNALGFTINLFNYDAVDTTPITNQYSKDRTDGSSGTDGNGTKSGINAGKKKTNQLKFYETGDGERTDQNHYANAWNPGNGINQFTGYGNNSSGDFYTLQYANQGIVKTVLSGSDSDDPATRFPVLNTDASDKSTNYLFDTTPTAAKAVYSGVNNLFYLENQGAANERLVYDSNDSYAYYDVSQGSNGNFVVYDGTYDRAGGSKSGMKVGFFPFNQFAEPGATPCINPNETEWVDGAVDHHLGLTLNVPFTMPYNGDIHRASGQDVPMVFEFSGDDDMWVFVDGKLVLDIGGIHQPVRGTINFETGVIQLSSGTVNPPRDSAPNGGNPVTQGGYSYAAIGIDDANNPGYQLTRGDTVYLYTENDHEGILGPRDSAANRAGTTHTLQAFYLERGGCDSNLEISTNIHLMSKKKVNVEKAWHPSVPDFNKTSSVEVELIRKAVGRDVTSHVESAVVSTATLDETGKWKASWSDLPSEGYNASGVYDEAAGATNTYCDYSYYVREVPVHGCYPEYSNTSSTSIAAEEITYTDTGGDQKTAPAAAVGDNYEPMLITNMPQHTQVAVEKAWTDSATNDHASDSIWVQLYKTVDSTTTAVGSSVELKRDTADATKSWKHVFEDLDVLPAGGTYTVAEGKMEGSKFVAYETDPFQLNGKTYKQKSLVYTNAKGATVDALDGTVKDDAGKAVITNEPIQANIIIKKVDAKDQTVTIQGATFKVYKDDGATPVAYSATTDNTFAFANETASTFTTGTAGTIRVDGLIPGVYWFVETDTADGYLVRDPNHPIQVVVDANGQAKHVEDTAYETDLSCPDLSTTKQDGAQTLTVPNVPVYALPSAGGTGAYPFLAAGAFVAALALTSDDAKRRLLGLLGMGARR